MDISINGKPANIILEEESTIKELLAGLDHWLDGTGGRLSGLRIDEREIKSGELSSIMELTLEGINSVDIRISAHDEIAMEALGELKRFCGLFENASFDERAELKKNWEESAAKTFLASEIRDLHDLSCSAFNGEGISANDLSFVTDERLRELEDPGAELANIGKPVQEIAGRLTELPLDIQTGKDSRAVESVQLFSRMGEKLFRIMQIFQYRGLSLELFLIEEQPSKVFLNDFGAALRELTAAYENRDAVLAGDLAEYELSPRLIKLYTALCKYSTQGDRK